MVYGEVGAATAAFCWACSSVMYGRTRVTAWTINFAKNLFGTGFVWLHLLVVWWAGGQTILSFSGKAWFYLVISGLIGIAIGDTAYFRSLQILGPRRSLVIATTAPLFGALLGWLILGETISLIPMLGIVITITGIGMVVMDKRARRESPGHFPGAEWAGVACGLFAAFCQAAGGALSKIGMQECTPLEATFVRLLAAVVAGVVLLRASGRLQSTCRLIIQRDNLRLLLPASALGTWLGIWCSQIGFYYSSVAIATMLMSTSPLFAIPLVRIFDGHPVSYRAIAGTLLAIAGIATALAPW
jgi:drug/metabolite transporter (DMT)-like permease